MNKIHALFISLMLATPTVAWSANSPVPVATDSRIKTFVYSENDVFNVVAHYGYQSNIEFPANETVETISVGNRMGWQIVTAGRRMFIRPTLSNARTNMTVVTSKRAYQFDLTAVPAVYSPNEELAYVIRFFYPDERKSKANQAPYMDEVADVGYSRPAKAAAQGGENYNYTFSGDAGAAPVKVYDDGSSTYFKFSGTGTPQIASVGADKKEVSLSVRNQGEFWVVDSVGSRFIVRQGGSRACVYNEAFSN